MRTTIRMDDALLDDAKRHALDTGRSLTKLIQEAVVALIQQERGRASPRTVRLPVFGGSGLHRGIDIDRTSALLDEGLLPDSHES